MNRLVVRSLDYSCPGLGARTTTFANADSSGEIIAVLD